MYWRLISLVVVFVVVVALGSCSKGQSPAGRSLLAAHKASAGGAGPGVEFTEEELAILKLPLEERRRVLEGKLREKLIELYGRIPDKSASGKQVSDASSSGHKLERAEGGHIINELLNLAETAAGSVWTLSFAERIEGDLNLNGEVKIDDITPLAVHFGHVFPNDEPIGSEPPDEEENYIDFEIDRASTNDYDENDLGKIGIEDITPIAQNFNLVLESYNVYLEDESTSELTLLDALPVSRLNVPPPPHRAKWTYTITKEYLEDEHGIYIAQTPEESGPEWLETGDKLWVKPVFENSGEGGEGTKSEVLTFTVTPTDVPVAVLAVSPLEGGLQQIFTFDGSGSYHEHEGVEIETYLFDFNGDMAWDYEGPESVRTHTYGESDDYYPRLRVVDENGVASTLSAPVHVTVYGPPVIDYFTYVVVENGQEVMPPFAEPLELPVNILFKAKAHEQAQNPAVLLQWMKFDFDDDATWNEQLEVNEHSAEVEAPDPYWTITPDILNGEHSTTINSKLYVSDTSNPPLEAEAALAGTAAGEIPVTHAVPHLVLTEPLEEPCILEGGRVRFNASQSYDKDGPNGLPTKYEFIFGDGTSEIQKYDDYFDGNGDPIQNGYGIADYPDGHEYSTARLCTAIIRAYDEDYDTCTEPLEHRPEATVEVRVYGEPVWLRNELVDDGYHHGGEWLELGQPSIAVAINPETLQPGVAYRSIAPEYTDIPGWSLNRPIEICLFSQRTEAGWPGVPEVVLDTNHMDAGRYVGYQCDLDYLRVEDDEGVFTLTTRIAATFKEDFAGVGFQGILRYFRNPFGWTAGYNPLSSVQEHTSVRLVENLYGPYVHYFDGTDEEPLLYELRVPSGLEVVEAVAGANLEHDHKPYLDDKNSRLTSALYVHDSGEAVLKYEILQAPFWDWRGTPETVSSLYPPLVQEGRSVALDFFGDEKVGALWIDNDYNLVFRQKAPSSALWGTEEVIEELVRSYCDFDYEEHLGIPCVAYEQPYTYQGAVYTAVYVDVFWNGRWLNLPRQVDLLPGGTVSCLDLDVANGYIYVAYSKREPEAGLQRFSIRCAILDFFQGNR